MFECDKIGKKNEILDDNFKILIVEDARVINTLLTRNLQKEGYECYQSFDLKNAKEVLQEHEISLIILDLHLSDGDGEELIFHIQEIEQNPKIVIFTSDNDLSRRDELFRLGILDYVLKGKHANIITKEILCIIHNIKINPNFTILIVDDSAVIRKMISRFLLPNGYKIIEAKNGPQSLEIIKSNNIDLVLLDMEMSDMNGMEVLKKIKQDERYFNLPIFIISSTLNIEVMRNAYKEGALDYFKKPFSPEELKLKVEQIIKQKQNEIDLQCNIEATNMCREFLDRFFINAIFHSNSKLKWADNKFLEYFGKNLKNLTQTFSNFNSDITTEIIIALKNNQIYKADISDNNNRQHIIRVFPLKNNEFLVSVDIKNPV